MRVQVATPAEDTTPTGDGDAPLPSGGLQESEHEPTTVAADDTPYTSAQSFEDLNLREDLLKVSSRHHSSCNDHGCQYSTQSAGVEEPSTDLPTIVQDFSAHDMQGLYTEMKFERPSRIQSTTLPLILRPPWRSMIAQVS